MTKAKRRYWDEICWDEIMPKDTSSGCMEKWLSYMVFCLRPHSSLTIFITAVKRKNMMCAYVCAQLFSSVHLFVTPWTVAWQAPLSMEVTRQDYWSGLPCPPPRDHPDPGIKPVSPALTGMFFTIRITWEAHKAQTGVKERESRGGQR